MVMFREDEQKMIAAERAAEPRWKKRLRLAMKIVLISGAILFISLMVLNGLAGKSDALKKGLEEYIGQTTGMAADIGTLNGVTFFPVLSFSINDLNLYQPLPGPVKTDLPLRGKKLVSAAHMAIAMNFRDLVFSVRRIRGIDVSGLSFSPGVLDRRGLAIDRIGLEPKGYGKNPGLLLEGMYGKEEFSAALQMKPSDSGYKIPASAAFKASIGRLRFEGMLEQKSRSAVRWVFTTMGETGLKGSLDLMPAQDKAIVAVSVRDSVLHGEFSHRHDQPLQGRVETSSLNINDAAPLLFLITDIARLWPEFKAIQSFNLLFNAEGLKIDSQDAGRFSFTLTKAGPDLSVGGIQGSIKADRLAPYKTDAGDVFALVRDGLHLTLPAHPDCMIGKIQDDEDIFRLNPVAVQSPGKRFMGMLTVDTKSRNADLSLKPAKSQALPECVLP